MTTAIDDLERLKKLRDDVEGMIIKAVNQARREGASWYDIGPALGVTRQAAMERYRPHIPKHLWGTRTKVSR